MSGSPANKAVILARGLGTRMRRPDGSARIDVRQAAAADSGVKAMVPVGRPFLDYLLSALADVGLRQACLVVGPEHEAVRAHYTATAVPSRVTVTFATQEEPLGTADAVLAARDFAGGDDFLVLNSDNYYPASALTALRELGRPGAVLFDRRALLTKSNIPLERIRAFALCLVDASGDLRSILEKPGEADLQQAGPEALVSMNCWRFSPSIFEDCANVARSVRGEFELPQAVRDAIARGQRFRVVQSDEGVLDLSTRGDIEEVTRRLADVEARP